MTGRSLILLLAVIAVCCVPWESSGAPVTDPGEETAIRKARAESLLKKREYAKATEVLDLLLNDIPLESPEFGEMLRKFRSACDGSHQGARFVETVKVRGSVRKNA